MMLARIARNNGAKYARNFSAAAPKASSGGMKFLVVGVVAVGVAYTATEFQSHRSHALWLPFAKPVVDVEKAKKDIIDAIEADNDKRADGTSIAATLIRLAWHASGTYSKFSNTGGSNGATMRFAPESDWGANAGLKIARDFLEPLKQKHNMSYGDIWTLAGAAAVEQMGGPVVPWRQGRTDSPAPTNEPDGRLPNADMGCPRATGSHLRDIFGRMGFNDREIVCLSGAHAVGRCHTDASGYWGPWSYSETTFSTEYYRLLLEEQWTVKITHEGKPWTGPMQYETKDKELMMLPSDLLLVQDAEFKKYVEMYAKDSDLFERDFAAVFSRLLELGVDFSSKA